MLAHFQKDSQSLEDKVIKEIRVLVHVNFENFIKVKSELINNYDFLKHSNFLVTTFLRESVSTE